MHDPQQQQQTPHQGVSTDMSGRWMLPAAPPFPHPTYPTPAEPHPPSPVPVVAGYHGAETRWSSASSSQGTDTTSTSTTRRWMAVDDRVTTTSDLVGFPPSRYSSTATCWHGESASQPTGIGSEVLPEASSTRRSDLIVRISRITRSRSEG